MASADLFFHLLLLNRFGRWLGRRFRFLHLGPGAISSGCVSGAAVAGAMSIMMVGIVTPGGFG